MIYRDYRGMQISALGMGAMRLPVIGGDDAKIDVPVANEMVDYAYEHGINYYDTAWGYHGENSEVVMGEALRRHPRDTYMIATKFPGYFTSNFGKVEQIFNKQLEKTGMEYFDFYLCHNVCELNIEHYLDDEKYGTLTYLKKQRELGRIRNLGFSVHGNNETLRRFLEKYGEDMEFIQIQLNWLDWSFQDAKEKVALADQYNLPIVVMEPMRGGMLVKLADQHLAKLAELRPDESAAGWAFRWLQGVPQVFTTLTGASTPEQLAENIAIYETDAPTTAEENAALYAIAGEMTGKIALPCTACKYCVSHCPKDLDIPRLLELYNEHCFTGGGFIAPMALMSMSDDEQPSACIGCGACSAVCPQQIDIPAAMADFAQKLG